jgi:hypothetical protein
VSTKGRSFGSKINSSRFCPSVQNSFRGHSAFTKTRRTSQICKELKFQTHQYHPRLKKGLTKWEEPLPLSPVNLCAKPHEWEYQARCQCFFLFCLRESKRCYTMLSFDCIERSQSTHPNVNKVHWDSFGRQFVPEIRKHLGSEGFSQTSWFSTSCSLQFLLKNCEQRHHHQWPLTHQIQVAAETPNMSSWSNWRLRTTHKLEKKDR